MGRRPDLSAELVDAAREVAKKTKDARELRQAMSVVLSGLHSKSKVRENPNNLVKTHINIY